MRFGKLLLGLLGGLTFGMLFAPKKGKELRQEILKKSGKSGTDGLKALGEALLEAGGEAYGEFLKLSETDQAKALKSLSKEKLGELLKKAEEEGHGLAGKVQDFVGKEVKEAKKQVKKTVKTLLK